MPKTILITGCSSGFGRITTLHLAQHGWRVFATVRKEADAASLLVEAMAHNAQANVTPLLCDVTNDVQVAELGNAVAAATPTLDALLNNAGTAFPAPLELLPLETLRRQLNLNVVAQLGVTQAVLPLLKAARGVIINVSSQGGRVVFPITGAYHMSKFALEAMSDALRLELAPFGVRVVVIQPGSSPTAIWETGRKHGEATLGNLENVGAYQPLVNAIMERAFKSQARDGFPPQLFADTVQKILASPNPAARYGLPARAARMMTLRALLPDKVWDGFVRRMLKW